MRPDEIPGLSEYANMVWTLEDLMVLRTRLLQLAEDARAGDRRRILFVVAPHNKYSGPLYEMVMVLDTWLRRKHARQQIEIAFSTYEDTYIQSFGPRLHEVVTSEFRTREITGYTNYSIDHIEPRKASFRKGETLPSDLLITFPPCAASTQFYGLPIDNRGFIAAELASRQVIGNPDVYAVGDAANYPVKQALLAFLQADAAAEHLSARILGIQPTLTFDQAEITRTENLDQAAFIQLPSRPHGLAATSMEIQSDLVHHYKIGSAPLWGLARRMVGAYLPWRFKADNPFHADAPWKGLELGLRLMPVVSDV
jgi:NADH dehydrogenase FAD-containing subunit